ncbi:hypothetical protein Fmac_008135 [Flemingia macrophylla]|uniref:Uncharacterized protein n=1 Tax=Flemingia macrophylla TaxID=520843 RepID=A0ABD1MWJ2_9FABA
MVLQTWHCSANFGTPTPGQKLQNQGKRAEFSVTNVTSQPQEAPFALQGPLLIAPVQLLQAPGARRPQARRLYFIPRIDDLSKGGLKGLMKFANYEVRPLCGVLSQGFLGVMFAYALCDHEHGFRFISSLLQNFEIAVDANMSVLCCHGFVDSPLNAADLVFNVACCKR